MNTNPLTRSNAPPSAWPPGTVREQLQRAQTPQVTPPAEQLELAALRRRVARLEHDIYGINVEGRR